MLNINNKISLLPIWRYTSKPLLILNKLYTNNALFIGNQTAKFQLNMPKQTIAIVAFVRSPQNISVSGLCRYQ